MGIMRFVLVFIVSLVALVGLFGLVHNVFINAFACALVIALLAARSSNV